jgi:hypothetical protein
VRANLHSDCAQKALRYSAACNSGSGFSRAGSLENIAHVVKSVLPDAGKVGVSWSWKVNGWNLFRDRPGVHPVRPVFKVAIDHIETDGSTHRLSMPNTGRHFNAIGLNLHAPAASMSELPAREVEIELLTIELESGGNSLDNAGKSGPVALPGGDQSKCHRR